MVPHLSTPKSAISFPRPALGSVLLTEASPLIGRVMVNKLQQFCRHVDLARDGDEAAAAIRAAADGEAPFDLVLINSELPAVDGYHTVRRLRQLSYVGPILAMTPRDSELERMQAAAAGCDAVTPKPIHWELLIETMFRLTGARRSATPSAPECRSRLASQAVV